MKKIFLIALLALLIIGISCQKSRQKEAQVEVIDGVTIIHNPETPIYPERTVLFEEELSIGGEDESGNIILYQPFRYAVDEKGNIYISDRQDVVIKKFNSEGQYVQSIGAEGEGPGEFQATADLSILPDGRLVVLDWRARRTSIFSADGVYDSSYKWRNSHFNIYLVTESSYTIEENIFGEERQRWVKTYDFTGRELVSFGRFTPGGLKIATQGNSTFSIGLPYSPVSVFAGDHTNQWLYHCLNDTYLIEVYDRAGKIIRKIDRPYQPLPFTDEDAREYLESFEESPDSPFAKMARDVKMPSVKTITGRMLVDEEGRLWVETFEEHKQDDRTFTAYDIFNKDGYYEARVWSDLRPGLFAKGKMYRMKTDEETGYRTFQSYRITWTDKTQ